MIFSSLGCKYIKVHIGISVSVPSISSDYMKKHFKKYNLKHKKKIW